MLKVQEYLKSGKTLDDLQAELGIEVNRHDTLPLAILNYNQIESPKTNPIVRECRALVLNTEDYSLVSRSFWRFFNWGEVADEMGDFDWSTAEAQEKVDGSLINFFYFDDQWYVITRGSFAGGNLFNTEWEAKYHNMPIDFTWKQGILAALGVKDLKELNLDRKLTYSAEFCSLWNKVVREYPTPCVYLLSRFDGEQEIGVGDSLTTFFRYVPIYSLKTADAVLDYVNQHPETTFEGCVVKDSAQQRWKIKNSRYVALHHLKGNNNLWNPKYMLPFILKGECSEIILHFPEATDLITEYETKVNDAYTELEALWHQYKDIENQKEFALAIQGKSKFTSLLFAARKNKTEVKDEWRKAEDYILKVLFK